VYLHFGWQPKLVVYWADNVLDFEWSNLNVVKFAAWSFCFDVFSE